VEGFRKVVNVKVIGFAGLAFQEFDSAWVNLITQFFEFAGEVSAGMPS